MKVANFTYLHVYFVSQCLWRLHIFSRVIRFDNQETSTVRWEGGRETSWQLLLFNTVLKKVIYPHRTMICEQ